MNAGSYLRLPTMPEKLEHSNIRAAILLMPIWCPDFRPRSNGRAKQCRGGGGFVPCSGKREDNVIVFVASGQSMNELALHYTRVSGPGAIVSGAFGGVATTRGTTSKGQRVRQLHTLHTLHLSTSVWRISTIL